ncbi:purine nucleoside phosphorylase-like [Anthonomus grandis grandis]|uniref:purine nucleoside phosphorylase-like n=1 Tax=Anthonomus grandis grandis TaxID=2921223 RepID=UPI002165848D|nr:purine nucleoside phosphorylase-like [Anthonomus grandis grandis]
MTSTVKVSRNNNGVSNGCAHNGSTGVKNHGILEQNADAEHGFRYTYDMLQETVQYLQKRVPFTPKVGIICGSGLGSLAECLVDPIEIPYSTIPHFPQSTVKGHAGSLVFGHLSGQPTICMKGRFHYYEGYPLWKCCMPIRVMKLLGVSHLIITNAAGGLSDEFKVGDIMLMKDHINIMGFAGNNPLQGPNDERFGPRFPPMNQAYNQDVVKLAKKVADDIGLGKNVHEGVYTCLGGPNFETVAELKMLKMLGADAVGMSTVHEVVTANHCDMIVFAFSLITNKCVISYETNQKPNHEEVIDVGKQREGLLQTFVSEMIKQMFQNTE